MSKNYIKVTFEAWPCELRNSLLIAMQCNICKYCIMVTVICVKYAWHKDGAVLNIDMIQQTCVCSTSKICWFFNDLIHGRERWVGSIWIVLNVNIKIPTNHAVLAMLRMIYFVYFAEHKSSGFMSMPICWPFLPSDLSAMHKAKPMNSWTHGRMHDMTRIPFSWGKLN